jgi:signal transduction histidine kinase
MSSTSDAAVSAIPSVAVRPSERSRATRIALVRSAMAALLLGPGVGVYVLADALLPPGAGGARTLLVAALLVAAGFVFPPLRALVYEHLQRTLDPEHGPCKHALATSIHEIGKILDLRSLAPVLAQQLRKGVHVDQVELWIRDPERDLYRRRGRDGAAEPETLNGLEARGLDAWIAGAGEQAWVVDIGGRGASSAIQARLGGVVWLPLSSKEGPLGVLVLGPRRAGRAYSDDQLELLAVLASQVAVVIENGRLYEELTVSNEKLTQSKRLLQQASRLSAVGTIAAGLVHEIRNPLAAVQTFLQILPDRLDDPEVVGEFREVALGEIERVSKLVGELLGMARPPAAKFEPTPLDEVVDQVVRLLRVAAERKRVEIRRTGDALPTGYADGARLKQALLNLILNAIQATAPGTAVTVRTRTDVTVNGQRLVEVIVDDEGPGIPADRLDTIFQPFATTKEAGTGLGLSVTHEIVAEHGGRIHVESTEGRGAKFIMQVPIEPRQATTLH